MLMGNWATSDIGTLSLVALLLLTTDTSKKVLLPRKSVISLHIHFFALVTCALSVSLCVNVPLNLSLLYFCTLFSVFSFAAACRSWQFDL